MFLIHKTFLPLSMHKVIKPCVNTFFTAANFYTYASYYYGF